MTYYDEGFYYDGVTFRILYSFEDLKNKLQELDEWELVSFVPETHHPNPFTTSKGVKVIAYTISGEIVGNLIFKLLAGQAGSERVPTRFILKNIHPRNSHREFFIKTDSNGTSEQVQKALSEFWSEFRSKLSIDSMYDYD